MNKFEKKLNPHLVKREKSGPVKIDDITKGSINERLARRGTMAFGPCGPFMPSLSLVPLERFLLANR